MTLNFVSQVVNDAGSIWIRADDAYIIGEIYTLYVLIVWFFAERGFLSIESDAGAWWIQ